MRCACRPIGLCFFVCVAALVSACQPAVRTVIPLEEAFTRNWLVSVEMSEQQFLWGLDTGAPFSLVDPEMLELVPDTHAVEMKPAPPGFALSGFSSDEQPANVELVVLRDYRLATARITRHQDVAVVDLGHFRERGLEIYGILGLDALRDRPFMLDPCALELTIFDSPPRRLPAGAELPIHISHAGRGYITLQLTVDGKVEEFVLDTGANYSSMAPAAVARVFGERSPDASEIRAVGTVVATREDVRVAIFQAAEVELAGVTLSRRDFRMDEGRDHNLLGMDLIAEFRWYFDLDRGRAIVKPALEGRCPVARRASPPWEGCQTNGC